MCKAEWSQDHLDLQLTCQKNVYTHLLKKILYVKLTYYDYLNKNVEHSDLRTIKI